MIVSVNNEIRFENQFRLFFDTSYHISTKSEDWRTQNFKLSKHLDFCKLQDSSESSEWVPSSNESDEDDIDSLSED